MKTALEGAIKPVFPSLLRIGSESELDPECQGSMLKMLIGVRSMRTWAINSEFLLVDIFSAFGVGLGPRLDFNIMAQLFTSFFIQSAIVEIGSFVVMDASGKLPNGIFSGTSAVFGNFDQCLSIMVGDPSAGGFR